MTENSAFHDLPLSAFPFTIRFYRESDDELVHEIRVEEPGVMHIPGLLAEHGRCYSICEFPDFSVDSRE